MTRGSLSVATVVAVAFAVVLAGTGGIVTMAGATTGQPTFTANDFSGTQGETVVIEVDLETHTDEVEVIVGDEDYGYQATIIAEATSGSTVEIEMDAFRAGGWDGDPADEVFTGGENTNVVDATRDIDIDVPLRSTEEIDEKIPLELNADGDLMDRASIDLEERALTDIDIAAHPYDESPTGFDDVDQTVTSQTNVSSADGVYVNVEATGLSGYLDDADDLATGTQGTTLTLFADADSPYGEPEEIDVRDGELHYEPAEGEFYFEIDTSEVEPGQYIAAMTIDEENPYVESGEERVETTFAVEEPAAVLTTESVAPDPSVTVSGESTLAPGTPVEVSAESDRAIFDDQSTTVNQDGTFDVTYDLTDAEQDDEVRFDVVVDEETYDERALPLEDGVEPELVISTVDTPAEVEVGEPFEISATLENPGTDDLTSEYVIAAETGDTMDEVTLGPGESTTVSWATTFEESGTYGYGVFTPDDEYESQVTVIEVDEPADPDIQLIDFDVPGDAEAGDTMTVAMLVENVGDGAGSADVRADFTDGHSHESETVTLEPGQDQIVELEAPVDVDPGTQEFVFGPEGDEQAVAVDVAEPTTGEEDIVLEDVDRPSSIEQGEDLEVTVEVRNVGDAAGSEIVVGVFEGEVLLEEAVDLEPGETDTLTFETTVESSPGPAELIAGPVGDEVDDAVEVVEQEDGVGDDADTDDEPPADDDEPVVVDRVSHPESHPVEGDSEITLTNAAASNETVTVGLAVDNETVDETSVEVPGEGSTTVELAVPSDLEEETHEFAVILEDEVVDEQTIDLADDDTGGAQEIRFDDDIDGQPGFTAALAVIALLSVAAARVRR